MHLIKVWFMLWFELEIEPNCWFWTCVQLQSASAPCDLSTHFLPVHCLLLSHFEITPWMTLAATCLDHTWTISHQFLLKAGFNFPGAGDTSFKSRLILWHPDKPYEDMRSNAQFYSAALMGLAVFWCWLVMYSHRAQISMIIYGRL